MNNSLDEFNELFDLERRLRSESIYTSLGVFAEFFKKHENNFKILTASIIRLLDYFKSSNNYIRFKIIIFLNENVNSKEFLLENPEELIKRLASLYESNDTFARTMILKIFEIFSKSLRNDTSVQYRILVSLKSEDHEELNQAMNTLISFMPISSKDMHKFIMTCLLGKSDKKIIHKQIIIWGLLNSKESYQHLHSLLSDYPEYTDLIDQWTTRISIDHPELFELQESYLLSNKKELTRQLYEAYGVNPNSLKPFDPLIFPIFPS